MSAPPGTKHDEGKPQPILVFEGFPLALAEVVKVATDGAEKYSSHGWRVVPDAQNRYLNAAFRHLLADCSDEWRDSQSGSPHLAHAIWGLLAVLEFRLRGL